MDAKSWNPEAWVDAHVAADRSPRSRVRRLVAWILEDPARPLDVERLAERAAVSPRTLSRLFRSETGTSPARFVAKARVELARRLLARCGTRVKWVAARTGFENPKRMRRAFHRALGHAPRAETGTQAGSGSSTMRR